MAIKENEKNGLTINCKQRMSDRQREEEHRVWGLRIDHIRIEQGQKLNCMSIVIRDDRKHEKYIYIVNFLHV